MTRSRNQRLELHHDREELGRANQELRRRILKLQRTRKEIQEIVESVGKERPEVASHELWLFARRCCGKQRFPSDEAARGAMELMAHRADGCEECKSGKKIDYYYCRFCGQYHVGHTFFCAQQ